MGHLGCFADNVDSRALNDLWAKDPAMTVEMCRDMAAAQSLRYFGVQYGVECYATNDATSPFKYGKTKRCNMACAGNAAERCGGNSANDVYVM
jgi:hypothetical protein